MKQCFCEDCRKMLNLVKKIEKRFELKPLNYQLQSWKIIHLVASVHPSTCLFVDTLLLKLFDLDFLAGGSTLALAKLGLQVKVVGQKSRSNLSLFMFANNQGMFVVSLAQQLVVFGLIRVKIVHVKGKKCNLTLAVSQP